VESVDVVIVGAGLAGLCCALELVAKKRTVTVLEASDAVGGRVRTDVVDGFRLDRGFQVFLTAYPEAQRVLDYDALRLGSFYPGALVRCEGKFHKIADPRKRRLDAAKGFLSPVATLADKARLAVLEHRVKSGTDEQMWERPERATIDVLREAGFAETTIDRFFRPFFGGVFFDRDLSTSSRMFEFVFRMFSGGRAALPAAGMQAIPEQLAARLPAGTLRLNARVKSIDTQGGDVRRVELDGGTHVEGRCVVIATDLDSSVALMGEGGGAGGGRAASRGWRATSTLWFACEKPPVQEPILVLDGESQGPVNHAAVPSLVCPTYAPTGAHLVGLSVADQRAAAMPTDELEKAARAQMSAWFGESVKSWRLLRHHFVEHALPDQAAGRLTPSRREIGVAPGVFACGDHLDNASINGAMESGRRAAEAVDASLG
jgi:phytoene dehydrogenase-like protein